jgi:hypothetical protein
MFLSSTHSHAGVAAASLLIGGILLALPSTTNEPAVPRATTRAMIVGAPATTISDSAPAAPRTAAAPGQVASAPATRAPAMAGMVVGIDPETGEMGMPTPDQMQKLSESPQYQVDHSSAGLLEIHHPDGSVSIDLQGRFQEYATVRIGPDGKLIYQCVDGPENAKRVLESSAPAGTGAAPPAVAPVSTAPEER